MSSFGIEEEFFMIDERTCLPAAVDLKPFRQLSGIRSEGLVQHELLACQLEYASSVCEDRDQALAELRGFRIALARQAAEAGLLVVGIGAAPMIPQNPPSFTDTQRYKEIGLRLSGIAAEHYICGLHIHVSILDRRSGVRALNFLRPWLPLLCALGANSPIWRGTDSQFSSWRTIQYRKWSVQGVPPSFTDEQDYESRLGSILGTEAVLDHGHIGWAVRLSENYPTIELRVADTQLRAYDAVLLAVLTRALVDTAVAGEAPLPVFLPELLDLALWQAAKHGIEGNQLDPLSGNAVPTVEHVHRLLHVIETELRSNGDYDFVVHSLRNLLETGNGAMRQRAAFMEGSISHVLHNAHAEMLM